MPVRCLYAAAAVTVALMCRPTAAQAQTWRAVDGGHFTVISDAPERRIRTIAWQFEQMRAALAVGLPWARVVLERPVVVIAAKDENSMRRLAPEYWEQRGGIRPASVFVGGADRYYIALRTDLEVEEQGMNPHRQAYWAYSALVLGGSMGGKLPLWVVNGLAGVLSNTIVRDREVEFGKPMPWMAASAKEGPRLPLVELFAVDRDSEYYRSGVNRERFDAQTWALLQFMIFGYKDQAGPRFDQVIQRLAAGVPAEAAVTAAYGSVATLEDAYLLYVQQSVYSYGRLPTDAAIVEAKLPIRETTAAEHAAIRAGFHVAMGREEEARELIAIARKADAATPGADDVEALLADRAQQVDQARGLFARAAAAGSTSYWTYYRLASLRTGPSMSMEDVAAIEPLLERATTLNPQFTPAFSFLADIQARLKHTDGAIVSARHAIELDTANVNHYLQLARILAAASRREDAAQVARQALALATTPQQRTALESFVAD